MSMRLVPLLLPALLWLPGCGPGSLNVEKTLNVGDEVPANSLVLAAQSKPQKITVEFTSPADVAVLLFKEEDIKGEDGLLTAENAKALGKEKGKTGSFSADVPANTATRVVVRDARAKADVQIKVTNK